ncbi:hypothetical protein MBCUT_15280 [Methanobrevibacter cuticularis]|uniref:Uncharacterized protein n=1 Tax=Methanobrevibacter cuticularis TaxID=47311 RepID=A0A166DCD4_9EURY|nr:hypothetical protein [Methanobrevibacter cuticularis]KZX15440.1 hypothetical protein MBCUT_15280 [Methanobrevibacter cuticularis]
MSREIEDKIKKEAKKHIDDPSCHAGNLQKLENGNWLVPILNKEKKQVSGLEFDKKGKFIGLA